MPKNRNDYDHHFDIAIIGGGLTGLTAANACAHLGLKVCIIEHTDLEARNHKPIDGRSSAIAYGSAEFFKTIDVWDTLLAHAGPILDIRVSDNDSASHLHYDHELVSTEPMGFMLENNTMLHVLFECAKNNTNITILDQTHYSSLEADTAGVSIKIDNSNDVRASLLLVADGKFSKTRELLGISVKTHDYQQSGIVCTIEHHNAHHGLAQERFLSPGPFATLPLKDPHQSSLVWTEQTDHIDYYMSLSDNEFTAQIDQRAGHYLGKTSLVSKRYSYPLLLTHSASYISQHACLIGDAAHGIHPLAGQGFNLGIRDVAKLYELLKEQSAVGLNIGDPSLLNEYEKLRKFDAQTLIAITTGLNFLFTQSHPLFKTARRIGLSLVDKAPRLKKGLMRHAMGLAS